MTPFGSVLVDALQRHDVLLGFVTNGTLLRRRLTPEILPLLDTVTVSIDVTPKRRCGRTGVEYASLRCSTAYGTASCAV